MDIFATAKRQYRLQLRPDEVLAESTLPPACGRSRQADTQSLWARMPKPSAATTDTELKGRAFAK